MILADCEIIGSEGVDLWSEGVDSWSEGVDLWSEGVDLWSDGLDLWSEGVGFAAVTNLRRRVSPASCGCCDSFVCKSYVSRKVLKV